MTQQDKGFQQVKASQYSPQSVQTTTTSSRRNIGHWLLMLVLAPVLLLTWYLLSIKTAYLETTPAQVSVSLDTLPYLSVGNRLFVHTGTYTIELSAEGYQPLTAEITVPEGAQVARLSFQLDKLPGRVALSSTPAGATVRLENGKELGITPATVKLPAGPASLLFNLERFATLKLPLEVIGLDQLQDASAMLVPDWGEVVVETDPAQARLWVDGREIGMASGRFQLSEGIRSLEIRHPEYKTFSTHINLVMGKTLRLPPVKLSRKPVTFSILSEPTGANVSVDGRYLGQTPLDANLASLSEHQLIIQKSGYQTMRKSISLGTQAKQEVFQLQPVLGYVHIKINPLSATIALNGQHQGTGDMTLSLPAVEHEITATHKGYANYSARITPQPALAQTLNIQMETLAEARQARAPKQYKNSQGQDFKLVQAGLVLMGADRKEVGFQRNQTRREVQLKDAFYIGLREVTNAEYRKFAPKHNSGILERIDLNHDSHPVVNLSWLDSIRYCNWLSEQEDLPPAYDIHSDQSVTLLESDGYRLPTEAEWVWVARQPGGIRPITFPWGNGRSPNQLVGNFGEANTQFETYLPLSYKDGYKGTAPPGRFVANDLGLFDLGGNVSEWVYDDFNLGSLETNRFKVVRGSSWQHNLIRELRLAYRRYGYDGAADIGFRLARTL